MHYKGVKVYNEEKCIKNIKAYAKDVKIIAEDLKSKIIVKIYLQTILLPQVKEAHSMIMVLLLENLMQKHLRNN